MPARLAVWIGLLCSLSTLSLSRVALAENWPQFRGPAGNGLASEAKLPTEWGPEQNIAWKVKLPGFAWSQPVVWGNRVFVTTAIAENQQKPGVGQGGGMPGGRPGGRGFGPGGRPQPPAEPGEKPTDEADSPVPARSAEERADDAAPAAGDAPRRPEGAGNRGQGGQRGAGGQRGRGGLGRGAEPPDQVYRWKVLCLDQATGQVLWEQLAHEGKPTISIHRTNTYASETPATDGERVYAYFGMTGLFCYDLDGKLLWSKDLGSYPMMMGWGTGSSPVVDDQRVYVQCDNEQQSFLVAFDKRTGEELWRVAREEKSNWSTPVLWKNAQRTELIAAGRTMRSYDPANGHLLWELADLRGRCSATPLGTRDLLYLGVGGGQGGAGPLLAIRAGAEGKITLGESDAQQPFIAWSQPKAGPPMASPLAYQDCLYILEQRGGILGCYDALTGKQHFRKRIEGAKGFTASPWAYDGKVFCLDEDGQTFVLAAGPELKVLATNKLDDSFWSSVAVAGDHLLLRGVNYLYSIGPPASAPR